MKKQFYRHGDLGLLKIDKLPKELRLTKTKIAMVGSHGNNHSIDTGKLYFKKENDFVFGYLVAKNTNLLHPEHKDKTGKAKIPDGIYQLIKQNEYTPQGLIPVVD